MRHALTIAGREIRERKMVFGAAALIAVLPFLFALLPATGSYSRIARLAAMGSVAAFCWTVAISGILGASLLSRELADRRLSFYLTKPISAPALWFGKLLAALTIIATTFAIALTPTMLVAWEGWRETFTVEATVVVGFVTAASIALLLLIHAIATMLRSRSPLVVVDLLLTAALAGATYLLVRPLVARLSLENAFITGIIVVAGVILSIVPGGVYQVARGRSDLRSSHAALSRFTWIASLVVLAIAGGFVAWILAADPNDLVNTTASQAPRGNWAWVSGDAKHRNDYKPLFVMNVASGVHASLPGTVAGGGVFSRDGGSILWGRVGRATIGRGRVIELMATHLNGTATHRFTGYSDPNVRAAVLSDDGSRLAAIGSNSTLSVVDIGTQRILASTRISSSTGFQIELYFADQNTVRLVYRSFAGGKGQKVQHLGVYEFSVPTRRLTLTGETAHEVRYLRSVVSDDGARMLLSMPQQALVVDARTLQPIQSYPASPGWYGSLLLQNGDVVLSLREGRVREIMVYDAKGALRHRLPMGADQYVWMIGEVAPSKVAIIRAPGDHIDTRKEHHVSIIDCARGVVERDEPGLLPVASDNGNDPRLPAPDATRPMLVFNEQQQFWRWNPLTGEKSKI